MRLWSTQLIEVLPKKQLVAQWRELSSIAGSILKYGTPNHMLVNFVMDYSYDHFISYAYYIRKEMTARGYRTMECVWNKIVSLAGGKEYTILPLETVYNTKMDSTYFLICYHNLLEKALSGGITKEEWDKVQEKAEEIAKNFLGKDNEENI